MLILCSVVTLGMHAQAHPYRNNYANAGETFLLVCLTVITAVNKNGDKFSDIVAMICLVISACYCVIVTLYLSLMFFLKLCRARDKRNLKKQRESNFPKSRKDEENEKQGFPGPIFKHLGWSRDSLLQSYRSLPSPRVSDSEYGD